MNIAVSVVPGLMPLSQFDVVAHVAEVPPVHVPSAAFAVGTRASARMNAVVVRRKIRWFVWVFVGLFVVCMDKLTYIQPA